MKKIAFVFEWIGVAVILSCVVYFGAAYFRQSILTFRERAALSFCIGIGLLCYAPIGYVRFVQAREKAEETHDESDAKLRNARKRSFSLKIICGIVLIGNGFLTIWRNM